MDGIKNQIASLLKSSGLLSAKAMYQNAYNHYGGSAEAKTCSLNYLIKDVRGYHLRPTENATERLLTKAMDNLFALLVEKGNKDMWMIPATMAQLEILENIDALEARRSGNATVITETAKNWIRPISLLVQSLLSLKSSLEKPSKEPKRKLRKDEGKITEFFGKSQSPSPHKEKPVIEDLANFDLKEESYGEDTLGRIDQMLEKDKGVLIREAEYFRDVVVSDILVPDSNENPSFSFGRDGFQKAALMVKDLGDLEVDFKKRSQGGKKKDGK